MSALVIIPILLSAISFAIYCANVRADNKTRKASTNTTETVYVPVYIPFPIVSSHEPIPIVEPVAEDSYRNPITSSEQKIIDRLMDEFVEKHPNGYLATKNPEFVENYLNRINLSELNEALGKD